MQAMVAQPYRPRHTHACVVPWAYDAQSRWSPSRDSIRVCVSSASGHSALPCLFVLCPYWPSDGSDRGIDLEQPSLFGRPDGLQPPAQPSPEAVQPQASTQLRTRA